MSDFPDFSRHGYQVEPELGQNYAGRRVTYLATDKNTQQSVVIKEFSSRDRALVGQIMTLTSERFKFCNSWIIPKSPLP
jgi:hypothetical protein